ncbi:multidrug effflux MFS transporter [Archangium lipolyticum]|uniref:multidrug effflux MFS transporter n=1 Tax=Archangium lipolyticum TaxID=2970465 RepID=UPI00214A7160|nr:multidrug effflux MFS transporter [Archangium lipolyticum]
MTVPSRKPTGTLTLELLLGALTAFAPLSIDMYLPALPSIGAEFQSTPAAVQLTLASFFAGLALGQLITGPLIDRFGRTRPLRVGIALYVLGSLGCALAPGTEVLVAMRFVQALGGAVAIVVSRAVVRDLWSGAEAARTMSRLVLVMGVAPILAPLFGGFVLRFLGWRAIFAALAIVGALALVAVVKVLPETAPPRSGSRTVVSEMASLLGAADFLGPALACAFIQAGMFAYISGSSFVFITLHGVSPQHFGWFFGANAMGLVSMSQLNRRLLATHPPHRILRWALVLSVVAASCVLLVAWSGALGLWGMAAALFFFVSTLGLVMPNATALALEKHASRAGLASAVLGALQYGIAASASWAVSAFYNGTATPMGAVLASVAALAWVAHFLASRARALPSPELEQEAA